MEQKETLLPKQLAEHLTTASVVLFINNTESGGVEVKPVVPGQKYDPENNPAHLLMSVITHELPNLTAMANGEINDSVRYQALREFAMLAKSDKERFEAVNVALQEYESKHKVNLAEASDPAAFDDYADFLADALLVTDPEELAAQPKEIVIPGSRIILPLR